ncbi:hypothetical protein FE845_17865 [Marinobacter sp. 1-4A]|uniref:hypothetical protein n=1 Tax=Marinobacter sp. 1-4A TaxID=2582919 RepID=UPI001905764B|nr:hypothetical protein [Marinobacter sp. 1-4A]MBK1853217.1 hypothetical protein [Marinobacter sp. 1-4A]
MTDRAKFKYSAQDGVLELEGSEAFVSEHFESLTDLIRIISRHVVVEQQHQQESTAEQAESQNENTVTSLPKTDNITNVSPTVGEVQKESIALYPEYLSEINGNLKIVSDIPGSSVKSKMTNAAILFCYGSKLLGDELVATKDIRTICEEHGFLDSANFSKIFNDRTLFLSDGVKGGNKNVKLTFQGEKKAKELLGSAQPQD